MAACGVAALIAAAVFFYSRNPSAPEYVTARIDRGDIDSTVTTTGNLNAVITVQVGSQVSGNIIALYADFNTKVKKGQLVAEIDPAPFKAVVDQSQATLNAAKAGVVTAQASLAKSQADLASAEANIASQKANLVKTQSAVELARTENERRKALVQTSTTSQEDADTAQANYEQAVAGVDAAQAEINAAEAGAESAQKGVEVARDQLDQAVATVAQDQAILAQAQLNLDHTRILAPVDGTVESRNMDVGQTVAASFQAPVIFLIAQDLTKMQVDTNVDESDVGPIRLNQAANFTVDAYPGQIFRGSGGANPASADQCAKRHHLRRGDRCIEPGSETVPGHDGERHDFYGSRIERAADSQSRAAIPSSRFKAGSTAGRANGLRTRSWTTARGANQNRNQRRQPLGSHWRRFGGRRRSQGRTGSDHGDGPQGRGFQRAISGRRGHEEARIMNARLGI